MTVLTAALAALPAAQPASAPAVSAEQIKAIVARLGADDFKIRRQAQEELIKLGPPARDQLKLATRSSDPEVANRSADILKQIAHNCYTAQCQAIANSVLWTFEIKDGLAAGPAIQSGKALVIGCDGKVYGVDLATGKKAYEMELPAPAESLSRPVADGGMFFLSDAGRRLFAIDAATGKLAWRWPAEAAAATDDKLHASDMRTERAAAVPDIPGKPQAEDGVPAVGEGRLFLADHGGGLHCFDIKNGKESWSVPAQNVAGQPVLVKKLVFLPTKKGTLIAYEVANGKRLWERNGGGFFMVADDQMVIGVAQWGVLAWSTSVKSNAWQLQIPYVGPPVGAPARATPVAVGSGALFLTSVAGISAFDLRDGSTLWTSDYGYGDDPGRACSIESQQKASGCGPAMRVLINGRKVEMPACYSVVVGGDAVYSVGLGRLHAFDRLEGEKLWSCDFGDAPSGCLALDKDVLYFGTARCGDPQEQSDSNGPSASRKGLPPGLHALKLK